MDAYLKYLMYRNLPVVKQLEAAVNTNDILRLAELVKGGIDVNMVVHPALENRPLHLAAGKGHNLCVQHLLQAGADPTVENKLGLTPLFVSFITGRTKCLQDLLVVDTHVKDFDIFWSSQTLSHILWNNSKDETIAVIIKATPDFAALRSNVVKNLIYLCTRKLFYRCLELFVRTGNKIPSRQLEEFLSLGNTEFLKWFYSYQKTPQPLKHYARLAVRKTMKANCNVFSGAICLDIPTVLVGYICYSEEIQPWRPPQ